MENRVKKECQSYKLGDYVVECDCGDLGWLMYFWWPDEPDEESPMGMTVFWGRALIEHDTLIMTSWKIHDNAPKDLQTEEAVDNYIASLPVWDKTKYFIKLADFGMSGLIDCQTMQPASVEIADEIMPKLGFLKVPA